MDECRVEDCSRKLPAKMMTYEYCSYHYRIKNEGHNPDEYKIRRKSPAGQLIADVKKAASSKSKYCIKWRHGKDNKGYGAISYNKKRYKAHRLVLILKTGLEPDKKIFACHLCDTPSCINPNHLYWGDGTTNAADKLFFRRH